jgi:hypothetical protein
MPRPAAVETSPAESWNRYRPSPQLPRPPPRHWSRRLSVAAPPTGVSDATLAAARSTKARPLTAAAADSDETPRSATAAAAKRAETTAAEPSNPTDARPLVAAGTASGTRSPPATPTDCQQLCGEPAATRATGRMPARANACGTLSEHGINRQRKFPKKSSAPFFPAPDNCSNWQRFASLSTRCPTLGHSSPRCQPSTRESESRIAPSVC